MSEIIKTSYAVIDIGEKCVECKQDTSFGSGRNVNRTIAEKDIEVGNEIVTLSGYMCPDCRMTQCDECDRDVLDDYEIFDNKTVCLDCCQSKYGWQECSDCEILNPVQDKFLEFEDRVMIQNDKGGYICHDCMAE